MLLVAAALIAAPPPTIATTDGPKADSAAKCPRTTRYYAWLNARPLQPHKLTELPPANAYWAVYRRIGGCEVPVVVKYGVGNR
jgi:hypothetical protein